MLLGDRLEFAPYAILMLVLFYGILFAIFKALTFLRTCILAIHLPFYKWSRLEGYVVLSVWFLMLTVCVATLWATWRAQKVQKKRSDVNSYTVSGSGKSTIW